MSVRKKLMSVVAAVATAAAMGATGVAANAADVVAVPQEGLSDTGASIAIVVVLVVVLAAIGVGVTVARKRQSATGARTRAPPRADWWPMVLIRLIRRPCSSMMPLRPRMTLTPVRRNPATPSDSGITAMCKRPSSEGLLR